MSSPDRDIRVARLQDQGHEDLLSTTTVEERFAMMWQLAVDAWTFMGVPLEPDSPRRVARLVRRGPVSDEVIWEVSEDSSDDGLP